MIEEKYTVEKNGFQGIFIKEHQESDKVMIVLGGSEGGINAAYSVAKAFAEKGGHSLALTAASLIQELEFVIAVSPAAYVFEGIRSKTYSKTSSWSWKGKPLTYLNFEGIEANMLKNFLKNKEMGFRSEYLKALELHKSETNVIKVENIKGPVLLLSAQGDAQWPAEIMAEMIVQRLMEKILIIRIAMKHFIRQVT